MRSRYYRIALVVIALAIACVVVNLVAHAGWIAL
jgi:hypothetical protein